MNGSRWTLFFGGALFGMGLAAFAIPLLIYFEHHLMWKSGVLVSDEEIYIVADHSIPLMLALLVFGFVAMATGAATGFWARRSR
jgi:hypothetical protein